MAQMDWGVGSYERTAEALLPAAKVLVDTAAPKPGEMVLDIGCGTGNAALLAASQGASVTAVDPSGRLLSVGRTAAEGDGLDVRWEKGDAEALPIAAGTIDCVVSNFGVIFAADPEAAAGEIARVLGGGGRALFTAWLPQGAVREMNMAVQELVGRTLGTPPPAPGFAWHEQDAVKELFSSYGMHAWLAGQHEIAFEAESPAEYLEAETKTHPLAVQGFQLLQQHGRAEEMTARLLEILTEHNEDRAGFRVTSRYVVMLARTDSLAG